MARLPYFDPADAPQPLRDTIEALPALNIFRMLAHAQTAFEPVVRFGGAILSTLELDPKLRELAVLQVAKDSDCRYEWVQHVEVGRLVGLTDEQITAVDNDAVDASKAFDELQRAVLRFTREVVAGPKVAEPTFAAVGDRLTPREVVELLLTIGDYLMIARLMTTLELDLDDAVGLQVTDATRLLLDR